MHKWCIAELLHENLVSNIELVPFFIQPTEILDSFDRLSKTGLM
jgi:hypothetical protein